MTAAPDGRVTVTVPRADGTAVTVTLAFDPATKGFAAQALVLSGVGRATVTVQHGNSGARTEFRLDSGGHIGADQLAAAAINSADQLGFSVTAA